MPSPTNRSAGQTVASADINALAVVANGAETAAAAAVARANHTGTQAISTVTSLQATLDAKETPAGAQAKVDAASTADRSRVNHTGEQAQSTVTGLAADLAARATMSAAVGYQTWNGNAWSTRPTGFGHVEAYSDGTRGSISDTAATAPTGAVDGDRWWKALA